MNSLEHTLDVLANNGRTVDDIVWIGTEENLISWETFAKMEERVDDLNAAGSNMMTVPTELKIVGDEWWMELEAVHSIEPDAKLEWAFRTKPSKPLSVDKQSNEEIKKLIDEDPSLTDFKKFFGDDEEEHNEVTYFEPFETYGESEFGEQD